MWTKNGLSTQNMVILAISLRKRSVLRNDMHTNFYTPLWMSTYPVKLNFDFNGTKFTLTPCLPYN